MAAKVSPMLLVLQEIRDELKEHRGILREHSTHLAALEHRQVETELRLATEIVALAHAVKEVRDLLRERLDQRDRVDELDRRVTRIEAHLPRMQ